MPFKFHKPHKSTKETSVSEEHPISVLRMDLDGKCKRIETSYIRNAPPHQFNGHEYHIPPFFKRKPADKVHLTTLEFTRDYIPIHTKDCPAQQALCGVYCIWYQETDRPMKTAKEYIEAEGEFWILRQLQWRPEAGEMIEYENVPEGMEEAMEGWWGKGVVMPKMKTAIKGWREGDVGGVGASEQFQ